PLRRSSRPKLATRARASLRLPTSDESRRRSSSASGTSSPRPRPALGLDLRVRPLPVRHRDRDCPPHRPVGGRRGRVRGGGRLLFLLRLRLATRLDSIELRPGGVLVLLGLQGRAQEPVLLLVGQRPPVVLD